MNLRSTDFVTSEKHYVRSFRFKVPFRFLHHNPFYLRMFSNFSRDDSSHIDTSARTPYSYQGTLGKTPVAPDIGTQKITLKKNRKKAGVTLFLGKSKSLCVEEPFPSPRDLSWDGNWSDREETNAVAETYLASAFNKQQDLVPLIGEFADCEDLSETEALDYLRTLRHMDYALLMRMYESDILRDYASEEMGLEVDLPPLLFKQTCSFLQMMAARCIPKTLLKSRQTVIKLINTVGTSLAIPEDSTVFFDIELGDDYVLWFDTSLRGIMISKPLGLPLTRLRFKENACFEPEYMDKETHRFMPYVESLIKELFPKVNQTWSLK
jgi:hypothetical protein